jgi:hypothetical protein
MDSFGVDMLDLATETTNTARTAANHHAAGAPARSADLSVGQVLAGLGDSAFKRDHGLRYAYVAGAMANGIAPAT